ncbi:MAG TPA: permease [Stellaceae bacterium]|nr:permease [Stellaceae bacterium]
MIIAAALLHALAMAFAMGWEILWALILGFALSAVVQAVVSHAEMSRLLPDDGPRSILRATLLGAASSSCSYAAVALARAIFRKGGDFTAAMAFQFASTNLVLELGIILVVLMGWAFALAEAVGGLLMIAVLVLLLRLFLPPRLIAEARAQADKGIAGRMEGHAAMDMSVTSGGSLVARILSPAGRTAISHYFVMDWAAVWLDIVGGLLLAGALAAWVPADFWATLFLADHPLLATITGPLLGPFVAVISFVCSVGNVPLAAVLWNGGASFGGVIAFIFADLIILPILDIYRRYYGLRMAALLFVTFTVAMALAALVIELAFAAAGLVPREHQAQVVEAEIAWNYTTGLNILFLGLAAALVWRAARTGGFAMLRGMNTMPADAPAHHAHHYHHH